MPDNVADLPAKITKEAKARGRIDLCAALEEAAKRVHGAAREVPSSNLLEGEKLALLQRLLGIAKEIDQCVQLLVSE